MRAQTASIALSCGVVVVEAPGRMRLMESGPGCGVRDVAKGGGLMQIQGGEVGERKRAWEGWKVAPRVVYSVLRTEIRCGRELGDGLQLLARTLCGGRA